METSAFRLGFIGIHPQRVTPRTLIAFEAARYVVTDKQPHRSPKIICGGWVFSQLLQIISQVLQTTGG
jgi:hypothetical protein